MPSRLVLSLALSGALVGACSSESEPEAVEPECTPMQFRACESDACSGVEQCDEAGFWGACNCTVLDASYADGSADAASEASDAPAEAMADAATEG